MSALILPFPRRGRGPIRVEHTEDDGWLLVHRGQAWPFSSREAALQEAIEIADQVGATIIVGAPRVHRGHSPC